MSAAPAFALCCVGVAAYVSMRAANARAPTLLGPDCNPLPDILHRTVPPCPVWLPDACLALLALYAGFDAGARARVVGGAYCYGHNLWVSGHTLVFAALAPACPAAAVAGACTLIAARQHYSIDVLGAVLLYHAARTLAV
jgi:hypothetical protein